MTAPSTLAIVDGNPVVARALKLLLQGAGYDVRSLEYPFEGDLGEELGGVRLLLLPPTLSAEVREALVGDIKAVPALAALPILALMASFDEAPQRDGLAGYIPWPCGIEELARRIGGALTPGETGAA
jgi:CheY-like chemotaxis protein